MTATEQTPLDKMPALLTVDEAAEALRRTPASVRWLIHKNVLPSGRIAGRRMIRRDDLAAFIATAFASGS